MRIKLVLDKNCKNVPVQKKKETLLGHRGLKFILNDRTSLEQSYNLVSETIKQKN